jgi:hypothetical protein
VSGAARTLAGQPSRHQAVSRDAVLPGARTGASGRLEHGRDGSVDALCVQLWRAAKANKTAAYHDRPRSYRGNAQRLGNALLQRARSGIRQHEARKVSVHTFSPDTALPQFDGAILASSTSVPYLTDSDLKRARFWIDDSHPRAASVEAELASRGHTLYIECFARGPAGLDSRFPFRLPSTRDCYTCFAEGYAAWQEGIASDFIRLCGRSPTLTAC